VTGPAVVVVGDALLDIDVDGEVRRNSPDAGVPVLEVTEEVARPGGAGLAAALLTAHGPVRLVTALADDDHGARLRVLLARGVDVLAGPATGGTVVKCRWHEDGKPLLRTDRGEGRPGPGFAAAGFVAAVGRALTGAGAVLVSDYGRGVAAHPVVRAALADAVAAGVPVVWDPHPNGPDPVPGVAVTTPNLVEACRAAGHAPDGEPLAAAAAAGAELLGRWSCAAVAVTVSEQGAVLSRPDRPAVVVPAPQVRDGDPCGAGDAFAGALARGLLDGSALGAAATAATRTAAEFVGRGGAGTVGWNGGAWTQRAGS